MRSLLVIVSTDERHGRERIVKMLGFKFIFSGQETSQSIRNRRFQGEAIVSETILPNRKGRVQFRGSWWFARCQQNLRLSPGESVRVVGINTDELTLLVFQESIEE